MLNEEHAFMGEAIMTWHTTTTTKAELTHLLANIRHQGGTVASCHRCSAGLQITWFTL
ncbi:MAG: hypothetical protein NTX33_12100 [Propionibacteriales bacterium]|nr:hypothetical protein [Propionibacteriales bacterium]